MLAPTTYAGAGQGGRDGSNRDGSGRGALLLVVPSKRVVDITRDARIQADASVSQPSRTRPLGTTCERAGGRRADDRKRTGGGREAGWRVRLFVLVQLDRGVHRSPAIASASKQENSSEGSRAVRSADFGDVGREAGAEPVLGLSRGRRCWAAVSSW